MKRKPGGRPHPIRAEFIEQHADMAPRALAKLMIAEGLYSPNTIIHDLKRIINRERQRKATGEL